MRWAVSILCLVIMIGAASCVPVYWGDTAGYFNTSDPSIPGEILVLINRERQKNDLPPVANDPVLSTIAQNHAEDMAARNYFSHTSPDGTDLFERLAGAGVSYHRTAENIAWGYRNAAALVRAWMGSPGHRKNILGNFTKVGIGSYRGYYVLLLIKE